MNDSFLDFFDANTDAVNTNRGFFFQYLEVLKTWINNYIHKKEITTYTEVDNDIKEVGDTLYFKQIKSFSKKLSLSSSSVRKSVFDFFILFLKFRSDYPEQRFCFSTNTALTTREKLLNTWLLDNDLKNELLQKQVIKKISELILAEFKFRKNKILASTKNIERKRELTALTKIINEYVSSNVFKEFVLKLDWEFKSLDPHIAVENLQTEILGLLEHERFSGKSPNLLMSVFLSEIYRCSQYTAKEQRGLTNKKIETILSQTDNELQKLINEKFSALLNLELQFLKNAVSSIQDTLEQHTQEINKIKDTQIQETKFVRELTYIPEFGFYPFIGREDDLKAITINMQQNRILSVQGTGGIGKSSLVMRYVAGQNTKDHLIWVTVDESILNAIVLNEVLLENLDLKFSTESAEQRLKLIFNKINNIQGNNLIVVDLQSTTEDVQILMGIKWPMIVVTRQPLKALPVVKLSELSFEQASVLFSAHCQRLTPDNLIIKQFFDYIHYNTLIIELTARTIEAGYDLTLEKFVEKLKGQNLNDAQLEIDIHKGYGENAIRLFSSLQQTFDIHGLDSPERRYLEFLALLPSTNTIVEELIRLCGEEYYDENKITIPNYLNKLDRKGWIELSPDKKRVSMHRMVEDMIIYKERTAISPFVSNLFYLTWLNARLKEGTHNPSKSFVYIKYAESILSAIKEPYRFSVNHHLLLMENEVLYTHGYYYTPKKQLDRWIDLNTRAELFLPQNDINRSIIINNLALSYNDNNDVVSAIVYFKKAIAGLRGNLPNTAQMIITYQNSLCQAYLGNGELEIALKTFANTQKLRKKYNLWDDVQLCLEYSFLARTYYICRDVAQAIKFTIEGIVLHKSFRKEKRNDFYLASYYDTLGFYHLENDNLAKSIVCQKIAINILESMSLGTTLRAKQLYTKLFLLYKYTKNERKTAFIKTKLEKFLNQTVTYEEK